MIKKITFKNFFSFRDTEIDLTNENILIGINGSGKTNFLRAFELLKAAATGGLENLINYTWGGIDEVLNSSEHRKDQFEIDLEFGNLVGQEKNSYKIEFKLVGTFLDYKITEKIDVFNEKGGSIFHVSHDNDEVIFFNNQVTPSISKKRRYERTESLLKYETASEESSFVAYMQDIFRNIRVYRDFETKAIKYPIIATSENRLHLNGNNLAQILNTFNIIDRPTFRHIKERLREVNPNFEDISFNFLGGKIELMLSENHLDQAVHVSKISDGTLKFLCLMAIFYNPNRGSVICIDEPETGLHPDMISVVADGIKYAAQTSQMIIATHSDHLLNHFALSNILVFKKDGHNATVMNRLSEQEYGKWLEDYAIGDLWRKGVIGGNRW